MLKLTNKNRKPTDLEKTDIIIEYLTDATEVFNRMNIPTKNPAELLKMLLHFQEVKREYMTSETLIY